MQDKNFKLETTCCTSSTPFEGLWLCRRSHFYPDYIVQTKSGEIWIIEAKGGVTADGTSKNIDIYAQRKFEALKDYCLRYPELKWGFVRAVGSHMFNHDIWKPINEIIV